MQVLANLWRNGNAFLLVIETRTSTLESKILISSRWKMHMPKAQIVPLLFVYPASEGQIRMFTVETFKMAEEKDVEITFLPTNT